jgi:di/tricarboxylate transporter
MMSHDMLLTFAILMGAVVLFLSEKLPVDLVALLVVVALGSTGILTPQEAFSGFSNTAVVIILSIFVLAAGLQQTGVTDRVAGALVRLAGRSEGKLVVVFMTTAALLSLFMNNIAAASVLMPSASTAAHRTKIRLSRLLMPMGFGTLLGGMATLFTTTNVVASTILRDAGYSGFGVLAFLPVGLPLAVVGIAYMALWGRRLLPTKELEGRSDIERQAASDLVAVYNLGARLFRARVPAGSYLIGRPLAESTSREKYGLNVVAVERNGHTVYAPKPEMVFQQGDILLLEGRLEEFRAEDVEPRLEILPPREYHERDLESASNVVFEAVLAPRSQLIGGTVRQSRFRDRYGMTVLGIWRRDRAIRTRLADVPLEFGDSLLLQGPRRQLEVLRDDRDVIVLSPEAEMPQAIPERAPVAVAIFAVTILVAAVAPLSVAQVILGGALAMVIAGVISMEQAYRAIEWRVVFLVAGMLPMGTAMIKTGATDLVARTVTSVLGPLGPLGLLLGLLALTVLASQAIKGAAVSAVLTPIAIATARSTGLDPRALAMGVALATSMAFITPLGHPVNILVMGVGGYTFRDFFKVGLPLTLLLFLVTLLLLPVFWPLAAR